MTERSYAKKNKLSYVEIKFDNNALGPDGEAHEFTRTFGKYERRVAITAAEAQLFHDRIEAVISEIYNLRRAEGRLPTKAERNPEDSTVAMESRIRNGAQSGLGT
jgi:hypothetical protein